MRSILFFTILLGLYNGSNLLSAKPLIAPDTVFISPASYNANFEGIGISTFFTIEIDNKTGVEIISIDASYDFNPLHPEDKTIINGYPLLFIQKTGNITLEDKSVITMEAVIFYNSPQLNIYENNIFINYKSIENGFGIDTVHIIANRIDSELFTLKQKLSRDVCGLSTKPESFTVRSSLLNGANRVIRVDSINFRSNFNLNVKGYLNKLFDYDNLPRESLDFPYEFNEPYLTVEIEFLDSIKEDDFVYVDYYTNKGHFIDTVSIAYSKKKGITAKSWVQKLKSEEYNKVESKSLGMRLCSEEGYKIKAIRLEGELEESEIELDEFIKVGEIIDTTFAELSKFVITPQKIPFQRSGAYVYELENMATGNIISVDFPFILEIDLTTDISDYKYNETHIYPNPVKDILNISSELNITKAEIIDPLGKVVYAENNSNSIDVSGLSKGLYFLKLTTSNRTLIEKVIIE